MSDTAYLVVGALMIAPLPITLLVLAITYIKRRRRALLLLERTARWKKRREQKQQ